MDFSELQETLSGHGYRAVAKGHYLTVRLGGLVQPITITFDYSTRQLSYTAHSIWFALIGAMLLATGVMYMTDVWSLLQMVVGIMILLGVIITEIRLVELKQVIDRANDL